LLQIFQTIASTLATIKGCQKRLSKNHLILLEYSSALLILFNINNLQDQILPKKKMKP